MKTEKLLVDETVLLCVQARRELVLEVEEGVRDPYWVRRMIREGKADFGPFPSTPVESSQYEEPLRLRILGVTDQPADIPLVQEGVR